MARSRKSEMPAPPEMIGGFSVKQRRAVGIEIWPDGSYFISDAIAESQPWIKETLLRNGDFWTRTIGEVRGWFGK